MKTSENILPLNAALACVAELGLLCAGFDVVKSAALAVWYGSETPDLAELKGPHSSEALQLVERLGYYSVVSQPRKKALLGGVRQLRQSASGPCSNFEASYKTFLPQLQPLQTRHYAAPPHNVFQKEPKFIEHA